MPQPFAQMIGIEQLADAHGGDAADLVLVAGADAAAGGADGLFRPRLVEAFFLHVIGENDVGVVADDEVVADGDAGRAEVGDFFEEARRVDDDAVADDGNDVGPQHAGRQQRQLEGAIAVDDGMAGVGAAVVADDEVVAVGEQIDDLALGLVAPLQADDTGAGERHEWVPRPARAGPAVLSGAT